MTDKQEKLYWRLWGRVVHANDWRFYKGRVMESAALNNSAHHLAVWTYAQNRAQQNHRSVTADDLRHGCHIAALGRDCAHLEIHPTREASRVFTLFKLLIEPDDLDAVMDWADPERDTKRRLIVGIKRAAPFAYIDTICRDKFKNYTSPFYEDLELWQLKQLMVTLSSRARSKGRARHSVRAELDPSNAPF